MKFSEFLKIAKPELVSEGLITIGRGARIWSVSGDPGWRIKFSPTRLGVAVHGFFDDGREPTSVRPELLVRLYKGAWSSGFWYPENLTVRDDDEQANDSDEFVQFVKRHVLAGIWIGQDRMKPARYRDLSGTVLAEEGERPGTLASSSGR
jgi:hypothetical protein